jgi:hypothetical protein
MLNILMFENSVFINVMMDANPNMTGVLTRREKFGQTHKEKAL